MYLHACTTDPTNLLKSCTLFVTSIFLIATNFDERGITPCSMNWKQRQSIFVHSNNHFSAITFNTASIISCKNFCDSFGLSVNYFLVVTGTLPIYAHTILNSSKNSDIFSWNISGLLHTPIESSWYSYFP